MEDLKVLISILNWNNWGSTVETIRSVLKSEYKNYKIVIIDNASIDKSCHEISTVFPGLELWRFKSNLGYAGAHKKAALYAIKHSYDLLWILNNDVQVYPFTLKELILAHERHGEALLGSVSLEGDGKTIHFGGGAELLDNFNNNLETKYNHFSGKNYFETQITERSVSDLEGASLVVPVPIIKKYGFINTRFFLYGEETDYCYSLRRKYNIQSIIVPQAPVIHRASQSFSLSPKLQYIAAYYFTRNINLVLKKHLPNYHISGNGGFPHLLKFFFKHYFFIKPQDKNAIYYKQYFTKLGYFHSLIRLKGKYLEPNKFLN